MKISKSILFFTFLCAYTDVCAQLSTHEQPVSFNPEIKETILSKGATQVVTTPLLDMARIEAEDKEDEKKDVPPRFGYSHYVHYDLNNSGTWYNLPDGGKLWQLNVVCPGALSVNFCYDKFWIPKGGKFFLYTKDQKQSIGAFTNSNNNGDKDNIRGFATELLFGNDVVLEYYQPKEVTENAIISINRIVHGYRSLRYDNGGYGQSDWCQIDINCPDGQYWQNEKKAVALVVVKGERNGSGALLNATDMGQQPYFLTADHCLMYDSVTNIKPDAEGDSILTDYTFYWNYEKTGCNNTCPEPEPFTTNGAVVVANYISPDFALLRLINDPKNITGYTPYYLGWDHSGYPGTPGVCIHHPNGDVKKISTVANTPIITSANGNYDYWGVQWSAGITADGSSGSPLLNGDHRLIGSQKSGNSSCEKLNAIDKYSMFCRAWTNYNDTNIHRRLDYWLGPQPNNIFTLEGLLIIPSDSIMNTDQIIYSNIRIKSSAQLTIKNNVELMGNSHVIVESGGELTIDGGKLSCVDIELKAGATLRIINDGTIECHNNIIAPVGAIVNIVNGKII